MGGFSVLGLILVTWLAMAVKPRQHEGYTSLSGTLGT